MHEYRLLEARDQALSPGEPYDSWRSAGSDRAALFFRTPQGFLVRFPGQADFTIEIEGREIACAPVPSIAAEVPESLFHNAIIPLLGNHDGGLFLHGSAVSVGARAIGFLAPSRRGKTTLAGGFARQGHAFLTEDVLELCLKDGVYMVQPSRPVLRLFDDSAAYLLGEASKPGVRAKREMAAGDALPFENREMPLSALYLLGTGERGNIAIEQFGPAAALAELMQHGFILDVEDKPRLRRHFDRLGELASNVPVFTLDFPRDYAQLPRVVEGIVRHVEAADGSR